MPPPPAARSDRGLSAAPGGLLEGSAEAGAQRGAGGAAEAAQRRGERGPRGGTAPSRGREAPAGAGAAEVGAGQGLQGSCTAAVIWGVTPRPWGSGSPRCDLAVRPGRPWGGGSVRWRAEVCFFRRTA